MLLYQFAILLTFVPGVKLVFFGWSERRIHCRTVSYPITYFFGSLDRSQYLELKTVEKM